jgi:hypothetical protein
LSDSASSSGNSAPTGFSPDASGGGNPEAQPSEQRNPSASGPSGATPPKSEAKPAQPKTPAKKPENSTPAEDDDPEEDVDGEKIKRSKLKEAYKRSKEIERASHQKFREAAEHRKEVEARQAELVRVANSLRAREEGADPFAIHRAAGATEDELDAIAERRLVERMKRAQMTPEQIEAEKLKSEHAQLKKQFEEQQEAQKKQKHESLKAQYKQHWDKKIADAMTAGNLARTASTGAKVARVISEYMQAGEDIAPELAAQIVRDNHQTEIRHEFTELREQVKAGRITQDRFMTHVSDLIGADTVKAIQASAIKKAQDFEPQKPRVAQGAPALPKRTFSSFEEANEWIDKRLKTNG